MNPTDDAPEAPLPSAPPAKYDRKTRGFGAVRRKGGRFYVRVSLSGKLYERGPFSTWNAADKMRRRAQTLTEGGTPPAEVLAACFGDLTGTRDTFRDVRAAYIAYASSRKRASSLADDAYRLDAIGRAPWAGKPLATVTPADLSAWSDSLMRPRKVKRLRPRRDGETRAAFSKAEDRWTWKQVPGRSSLSALKYCGLASAVFQWAMRTGLIESNPVRAIERPSNKGREIETYLTLAEGAVLIESCSPVLRPIVTCALLSGMRRGELLALRWRAVDFSRQEIRVEAATAKSKRGRTIPMTTSLVTALRDLRASRPRSTLEAGDRVFTLADGSPLERGALRSMFEATVARCEGIPIGKRDTLRFHDLRHSFASAMIAAGVDVYAVSKLLGHGSVVVTSRYLRFAPEAGRTAMDALEAAMKDPKSAPDSGDAAGRATASA